jgi:hypothetical protein
MCGEVQVSTEKGLEAALTTGLMIVEMCIPRSAHIFQIAAVSALVHTSLSVLYIYCRGKSIHAKLTALQIS